MTAPSPTRLSRKVLRDDVHDVLLEMLLSGEVEPGKSLSIDSLARQLGVSPTPVREALVELEHTGLVQRAALKGYAVSPPLSANGMTELMDARMVLELAAVERAALHVGGFLDELRAAHRAHASVIERYGLDRSAAPSVTGDLIFEYFAADWAFHQVLLRSSGNRFITQMAGALGANVHRMRQSFGHGLTDSGAALAEHGAVLAALEASDAPRAVAEMRVHLQNVTARAVADADDA